MRSLMILIAGALAFAAAPASAQQEGLPIEPGQAVALSLQESGEVEMRITAIARAEWTPEDVAAGRHLAGLPIPDAPVPYGEPLPNSGGTARPVEPGTIRLRFHAVSGRAALLAIDNGYDRALVYRARMTQDGKTRATDVCIVMPRNRGYEYWPHAIERLDLSDFRLVLWRDGQTITCQ